MAAEATLDGLRFHWSLLRRRFVPWQQVRDARFRLAYRTLATIPEVALVVGDRVVRVRGFDNSDDAGKRFAEAVRACITKNGNIQIHG